MRHARVIPASTQFVDKDPGSLRDDVTDLSLHSKKQSHIPSAMRALSCSRFSNVRGIRIIWKFY